MLNTFFFFWVVGGGGGGGWISNKTFIEITKSGVPLYTGSLLGRQQKVS